MMNRLASLAVLTAAMLLPAASAVAENDRPQPGAAIIHVVFVWLKEPGNTAHRRAIIDASRGFDEIDGVLEVRAGEPLASDRQIVDDSFDVGIYLRFATVRDLGRYLADARHQETLREVLRPLTERYLVYDIVDRGPGE